MLAAFAAYFFAGIGHSPVLTWAAVAVSVVAVVAWSQRGRMIGRPVPACGPSCSIEPEGPARKGDVPARRGPVDVEAVSVNEERP
jgi:hypothetical protein